MVQKILGFMGDATWSAKGARNTRGAPTASNTRGAPKASNTRGAPKASNTRGAPKARNMIARGKCERSEHVAPGYNPTRRERPERPKYAQPYFALSGLERALFILLPGATRSASLRACPWLSYGAPLALWNASKGERDHVRKSNSKIAQVYRLQRVSE